MDAQPTRVELTLGGRTVTLETGRIARQASGAVVARHADSVVLATVVAAEAPRPGADFFPLTVEYREKFAAAGRIPGSFQRREGRISDDEVLISRLIDRSLRSLFPDTWKADVQIQVQVLSADPAFDVDSLALLAACAAVHVSPLPADGPAAGIRVVRRRGAWIVMPTVTERAEAELDFAVSAGPNGLVMVEGEADEADEETCVAALVEAQRWLARARDAIATLQPAAPRPKLAPPAAPELPQLGAELRAQLEQALAIAGKAERRGAVRTLRDALLAAAEETARPALGDAFGALESQVVRDAILEGRRLDGRSPQQVRPIWGEVGWLPRTHGSAVFTRGETQALVTCTLGTAEDAQTVDRALGTRQDRFLLHYNFPPYSVNEIRPLRGPGRREIGHGNLARRGLARLLPPADEFPYTIRVESEISESNGSSSMATVCGGTMALLDAGVPLRTPVAGIAMGLVTDGTRTAVLSDILGDEDHLGDMDFKVVGTANGVTALQLDNKVGGLTDATLSAALEQAREGRLHILAAMRSVIAAPRAERSRHAPSVERIEILPDAIGALVGTRGATIKAIQAESHSRITIDDHGVVLVYSNSAEHAARARRLVLRTAGMLRTGGCYRGVVTTVKDFGAFVKVNAMNEGLVPREEFAGAPPGEGDEILVQVLGVDDRGRLRLSAKQAVGTDPARIEF